MIERYKKLADSINNYQKEKKTLKQGFNKLVEIIKEKIMKKNDYIFNPIIKTFTDKELDTNLRNQEIKLINNIITNKKL